MIENCTIKTRQDILNRFGTVTNAVSRANRYRAEDDALTYRQVYCLPSKLKPEWALFWSQVAYYDNHQVDIMAVDND